MGLKREKSKQKQNSVSKVSIVVLNWNGLENTLECIESLSKINYPNYEIIVVDNGSTDGSQQALRGIPNLILLENAENLGFSAGNNVGIRYALEKGTDYIFLLNNDTIVVHPDVITELVKVAEEDPEIGMVGPKICDFDKPHKIWFAGATINFETGESPHWGKGKEDDGRYNSIVETDRLTGCALMVKADVVRKIGVLDPDYFLYYEDVDWCVRAKKAGYKIVCVQYAKIWHKESSSTLANQASALHAYYDLKNRLLFLKKHSVNSVHALYCIAKLIIRGTMRNILRIGKYGNHFHRLRGLIDFCLCRFGKRHTYHP